MEQEVTNFSRFYGILKKNYKFATKELGEDFKEGIVSQFTDKRTTSLKEMTRKEYDTMCDALEGTTARLLKSARDNLRRHRSVCLHLMQQIGVDTADWARINNFCQHPRIAGKPFREISAEELEALAVKLRSIKRKGGLKKPSADQPPTAVGTQIDYLLIDLGNNPEMAN